MSDEEDDYMSDAVLQSCDDVRPGLFKGTKEGYRREQEQKIEESKRQKQKPMKLMESEKRDEGLSKSLDSTNKGFALLQKMGYKPGQGIGKSGEGRVEPVGIEVKVNRGGLGQEAEKRKRLAQRQRFLEEQHIKKVKLAMEMQDSFRYSKISEQRQRRTEKYLRTSQRVCEQLDHAQDIEEPVVFYYWPAELRPAAKVDENEDEVEEQQELPQEEEPEITDQLEEITNYLRTTHLYCIWCGYAFDDAESLTNDCPGNTADHHDDL